MRKATSKFRDHVPRRRARNCLQEIKRISIPLDGTSVPLRGTGGSHSSKQFLGRRPCDDIGRPQSQAVLLQNRRIRRIPVNLFRIENLLALRPLKFDMAF